MEAQVGRLPLPQRLGQVGVAARELPAIAQVTMGDYMMANVPALVTATDVEALLRSAL